MGKISKNKIMFKITSKGDGGDESNIPDFVYGLAMFLCLFGFFICLGIFINNV